MVSVRMRAKEKGEKGSSAYRDWRMSPELRTDYVERLPSATVEDI